MNIKYFTNIHNTKGCSITNLYAVSAAGLVQLDSWPGCQPMRGA